MRCSYTRIGYTRICKCLRWTKKSLITPSKQKSVLECPERKLNSEKKKIQIIMITVTRMIGIETIIIQISWSCNIVLYYQSYSIVLCASKAQRYIMVIELSGVQVELKSYA